MKLRTLIIIAAIIFIANGNAQNAEVIIEGDTAFLRVVYVFTQNYSLNESLSRTDTMALDIGDRLSVFYDMTIPNKTFDKFVKPEMIKTISVILSQSDNLDNTINNKNGDYKEIDRCIGKKKY